MRDLESKISLQEEVISSKEAQLTDLQSNVAIQQREIRKLSTSNDERLKLRDELDAVKRELEKQSRKANTAENYMKKLQASQGVEKERDLLRQELEDARHIAMASEKLRQENLALRKSNDETSHTLSQIEQEFEELRVTNKQLRVTRDGALQQVNTLTERFAQDQETIAELKDRQGESIDPSSPNDYGGLEGELQTSSKHEEEMYSSHVLITWLRVLTKDRKKRVATLERQNQQLEADLADRDARVLTLEKHAANTEASSSDRYTQIQELRQENIVLQTSLTQVQQGHPVEGFVHLDANKKIFAHSDQSTEVFKRMRDQLKATKAEKTELKDELGVLAAELKSLKGDRESSIQNHLILSELHVDLLEGSLVNKDKANTLEDCYKQRTMENFQLQIETNTLRKQNRALQASLENQAEQTRHHGTIGSTSNNANQDLANILQVASPGQDVEKFSEVSAGKIDNSRERSSKQQEVRYQISCSNTAFSSVPLSNSAESARPSERCFLQRLSKKLRAND